jgi:hypothetical protein
MEIYEAGQRTKQAIVQFMGASPIPIIAQRTPIATRNAQRAKKIKGQRSLAFILSVLAE